MSHLLTNMSHDATKEGELALEVLVAHLSKDFDENPLEPEGKDDEEGEFGEFIEVDAPTERYFEEPA